MRLEITNEKVNRLLHRTELQCNLKFVGATPTKQELLQEIVTKKHVDEKLVVIDSIRQEYGKKEASCFVKVYESKKSLTLIEGKKKEKLKAEGTPAPSEETPAEGAPEGEQAAGAPAEKPEEKTGEEEATAEEGKKE